MLIQVSLFIWSGSNKVIKEVNHWPSMEVMEFSDLCAYTFSTPAQNEKLFAWKFQTTDYDWLYKKVSFAIPIWPEMTS